MRQLKEVFITSCGEAIYKGEVLKQCLSGSHGYATIRADGKNLLVHRLVAKRWLGNPEGKRTVNHKDGNKLNNNLDNLEWATDTENNQHSWRELGRKPSRGRKKLPDELAQQVLDLKGWMTQKEIAKAYGVKVSLVADIHTGRRKIDEWEGAKAA